MSGPQVREATEADVPALVAMVHELAEYERAAAECRLAEAQLRIALFGPAPALFAHVGELDGQVAEWPCGS